MGFVALQSELVGPALILGIAAAGLYGLFAVPLVLTYQVSRTIGFVQGGITLFGMFLYWRIIGAPISISATGSASAVEQWLAVVVVVAVGAAMGAAYGWTVTGRLANWPRVRLTIYSLGWLLTLAAAVIMLFMTQRAGYRSGLGAPPRVPSVFGPRSFRLAGVAVTSQQIMTVALLGVLMVLLTAVLLHTRVGTFIRAIADDPDAGRWVGIPLNLVGTGVYALAGALSALAGVFIAATIGLSLLGVMVIFLRSLTVAVVGGFMSLPLALAGCLVLGIVEAVFAVDGSLSLPTREVLLMGMFLLVVVLINKVRPLGVIEAGGR